MAFLLHSRRPMIDLRRVPILLLASLGCGSDDAELPDTPDARVADGAIDARADGGVDATPSVLGAWTLHFSGGYYWHDLRYDLSGVESGGTVSISHVREDVNGAYLECLLTQTATATWTRNGTTLDVVPMAGRTRRETVPFANFGCDEAYPERDMTAAELRAVDFADGEYSFDHSSRLVTSTSSGSLFFTWERP